jgi:ribosomal protein S18 acetylase RimI-like enzyme
LDTRLHPKSTIFLMFGLVIMNIRIRAALPQDNDALAVLAVAAYAEYAPSLSADNWEIMRSNLANIVAIASTGNLIVAERHATIDDRQAELVGAVIYYPPGQSSPRLFQPEWASLRMLAVSPQCRGCGIGKQLSLECIARARQDNAEIIALHTSELMVTARAMYEKLGFDRERELPQSLGIRYWRYVLTNGGAGFENEVDRAKRE